MTPGRRAGLGAALLALAGALAPGAPGATQAQPAVSALTIPSVGRNDVAATTGELFLPAAAGPVPALVLLHGCAGVQPFHRAWAREIAAQGIAVLLPDQFTPRGVDRTCERTGGRMVEQRERRADTYAALHLLAARPDIDADRIAVMGFSNGAMTVLNALIPGLNDAPVPRFRAGIALYPDCTGFRGIGVGAPMLILVGQKDDWTPAAVCDEYLRRLPGTSAPVQLKTYPGAHHSFDDPEQRTFHLARAVNPHARFGHGATVGYDRAAHEAARADVRDFLRQHLLGRP